MPFRVEVKMFEIGVGRWEARLVLERRIADDGV